MKSRPGATIVVLASLLVVACSPNPVPATEAPAQVAAASRPALVLLVVVDQLRADLLDRYGDLWTGGFKRLREQGYSYVNASHAHAATETAAGHAALSTGAHPEKTGIVGNGWYEMVGGSWVAVSNVGDSTVKIVGNRAATGASPIKLMRSGLAEWIVSATPASIIASVSGKDRGAIQPAAHTKGYVYWFDETSGRYVTSTYYRDRDPAWVSSFNSGALRRHRADTVWSLGVPAAARSRANRDTLASERDGVHTFFPHRFSAEAPPTAFWPWWEGTPFSDAATLEFARTMVTSLDLGKDAIPDFLNVSLSVTDYVGHAYGPLSLEQLDNLMRLDRGLGAFFEFLDERVGRGRWTMMMSGDHGVSDTPEDRIARGEFGHRATQAELLLLDSLLLRSMAAPDRRASARELAATLRAHPLVDGAYTHDELATGAPRDSFEVLERRSMYPNRVSGVFARAGVEVRFKPGVLRSPRGSTHGSAWWHDRHVPMIFMGPGIPAGRDTSRAETVDFAPTIAAILGLPVPAGVDGKVLRAVVPRN